MRCSRWFALGLLVLATAVSGCRSSPTSPTPTLVTDTLSGTVKVGGSDSKTFVVSYALADSDASVTVTALTSTATGAALSTTIGVGFGSIAFDGSCSRSATYSSTTAQIGQELVASGVFFAGTYCVQVFDAGTLTGDTNYTIAVKHY